MNLEIIRSFLAVSKYKSLSKAASSLHITQPTLSARIKNLEEGLDVHLLTRDWHGVNLTKYGLLFLPHAIDMLNKLDNFTSIAESYRDIHNNSLLNSVENMNGTFKIGVNEFVTAELSEKIISLMTTEFPTIKFEIFIDTTQNLMDLIDFDGIDIIFYYSKENIDSYETKLLTKDQTIFVFNKEDYEKITQDIANLNKIKKPFLFYKNPAIHNYINYFHSIMQGFEINQFQTVNNLHLMQQLIVAGHGFGVIPRSIYHFHFNSSKIKAYPFNYLPKIHIYMTSNVNNSFKDITSQIYQMIVNDVFSNN